MSSAEVFTLIGCAFIAVFGMFCWKYQVYTIHPTHERSAMPCTNCGSQTIAGTCLACGACAR